MVDVGAKPVIPREAVAAGRLRLRPATLKAIRDRTLAKGDALEIARAAAVLAAKNTPQILPFCHPLPLDAVDVEYEFGRGWVTCRVRVSAHARTGVEMEALTAACAALLTIWDLAKPMEKDRDGQYPSTRLEALHVVQKVKG